MSFTQSVKEELARVEPVCSHCERATLAAFVRVEGSMFLAGSGRYRIEVATDFAPAARLTVRLLHAIYGLRTDLTVRRSVLHKTPNYLIEVPTQEKLAPALRDMGILAADGGLELAIKPEVIAKECCKAAYLRGIFLGSGFVSNPRGDFHFEVTIESQDQAEGLADIMTQHGIPARIVHRRNSYMVYLKSGGAIADFLAFVGAHRCALQFEEERVIKSVRNDVNRLTNADMANQAKSSNAAVNQILAIRTVVDAYGLENLSPALQDFIRLRLAHPDATLKELGEYANPPLSKSAVYHRVRRIEELASEASR